jgi:hypothetical protein
MTGRKSALVAGLAVLTFVMMGPAGIATASGTPAAAHHKQQAAPKSTARSATPATYPSYGGRFYHVAATSASNVWAVGIGSTGGQIAHWNGSSWTDQLFGEGWQGVSARSANDAWAVGGTGWFYPVQSLADHWNGKTWTQVPTPTPGGSAWLNAVAETWPTNAWAVGCICGGPGAVGSPVPLIEHWNGKKWTVQRFQEPGDGGEFLAVSATSARNAWAVGYSGTGTVQTLIEHWNGRRWYRLTSYAPYGEGTLQGVDAIGPKNVWAVGYNQPNGLYESLILHWNGNRWSVVPSPNPTGSTNLWDVNGSSATNVWAVGYTNPNGCYCGTVALHWNGKQWSAVTTPDPPASDIDALTGVVAISPSDAWAVGTSDWGSTILEFWNGKSWQD